MAFHANSTPAPARPLLSGELASFGLLPLAERPTQLGFQHDRALLAILDAGPISPVDLAFMSAQRRKRALLSIDALIDMLDAIEPDPDLEPSFGFLPHGAVADECEPDVDDEDGGDNEPSLGSVGSCWQALGQQMWSRGSCRDLEDVNEDGGDVNDEPHDAQPAEPSLGSLDGRMNQIGWAGDTSGDDGGDAELDDSDLEPSLGAQEPYVTTHRIGDQTHWSDGGTHDLERGDDNGIADEDGRAEQIPKHSFNLDWSNGGYIA